MSLTDVGALVGIGTGLVSLFAVIYLAGVKIAKIEAELERVDGIDKEVQKISRIELKVDTLWDFIVRRAMSEAVKSGTGTMNSPFIVTKEAMDWMEPMKAKLRDFVGALPQGLDDAAISMHIERQFGEEILKTVCLPRNLSTGECLLIALAVARDNPKITVP